MTQQHITSLNLIGCPTSYFASTAFNRSPLPIAINGVREMNPKLFETMDRFEIEDVPLLFMEHMRVMFELSFGDFSMSVSGTERNLKQFKSIPESRHSSRAANGSHQT